MSSLKKNALCSFIINQGVYIMLYSMPSSPYTVFMSVCLQMCGIGGGVRQVCGAVRAASQVSVGQLMHTSQHHYEESEMQTQKVDRLEKCEYFFCDFTMIFEELVIIHSFMMVHCLANIMMPLLRVLPFPFSNRNYQPPFPGWSKSVTVEL